MMRLGALYAVWYHGYGGFVRIGDWSASLLWRKSERDYVPLSERYGTTKTWRLGPLGVRRHGRLYRSDG